MFWTTGGHLHHRRNAFHEFIRAILIVSIAWVGCFSFTGCSSGGEVSAGLTVCKEHSDGSQTCVEISGKHHRLPTTD